MKLESIGEFLADELALVVGQTLWIHFMPADVRQGVMLREPLGGSRIDPELPGWRKTEFQVIVRDSDYARGRALALEISGALLNTGPELTDMTVRHLYPRADPYGYPLSIAALWEFQVVYDICYIDTGAPI